MSVIYFAETSNRKDFVTKIVKIFKTQLDQANSIFIKPNIVSSEPYPTTTHPEILDALLSHLSDRKVIVGDGHAVDTGYTKNILGHSPLKEICSRHGAEFVNLYKKKIKKWFSFRGNMGKIELKIPLTDFFSESIRNFKLDLLTPDPEIISNRENFKSIIWKTPVSDIDERLTYEVTIRYLYEWNLFSILTWIFSVIIVGVGFKIAYDRWIKHLIIKKRFK